MSTLPDDSFRRQISRFNLGLASTLLLSVGLPLGAAHATAHCFCTLGSPSAPIHDFGAIDSFPTQYGHDDHCKNLCNSTASPYMSNGSSTQTSACGASHGAAIATYSKVGTKPYQGGQTFTCPTSGSTPAPGRMVCTPSFPVTRALTINNVGVNLGFPGLSINVPISTPFTTFEFKDHLSYHVQSWTYEARLIRDGVLVEQLALKCNPSSSNDIIVDFTGQPNGFVHGHDWKVEWHYLRPGFSSGSVAFHVQ